MRLPVFGTFAPQLRTVPMSEALDLAAELEALGYGALWFPEANSRDVFVNIGLVLAATESIIGGTAIANVWARDALAMESAARTLTEAFPERFVLGLGVSHQPLVDHMRGHLYDKPLTMMRTYLDHMDAVEYTGHPPSTPVHRLLAALGPRMLELAAERSEGTLPYLVTPEHTAVARAAVGEGVVAPMQAVVLDDDVERGRTLARAGYTAYYMRLPNYTNNLLRLSFEPDDLVDGGSDRLVDALVAHGPVEHIQQRLQDHIDAGADHVGVYVVSEGAAPPVSQWRELAPALAELKPRMSLR